MEPDKCLGYRFFKYEDIINSKEVSKSCQALTKYVRKDLKRKKEVYD